MSHLKINTDKEKNIKKDFPDLESLMFKNKSAQKLSKKKKYFKNKKYSATSLGGEDFIGRVRHDPKSYLP